jgi:predicted amidophosphoribosyltransferase
LSPTERRKNLQQAYTVPDSSSIKDKKVLLVDGTMTTGSTLNVISKELITAGASAVYVLVFSRGIGLNIDN